MCSALGGVYLRVVWDTSVSDKPWVQPVPADVGVPDFAYDKLRSVTFWRIVADDGTDVLRHLEMHATDSNQIIHGLYQGGQTDLGQVVPMNTHPATARIFATLKGDTLNLPDLPDDAASVVYIPNIKPNKLWRDLGPELWPLGRSDYQGVEPLMDALDHAYCADEETEILTDKGWRGYRDLRTGDTVLTLNHETGLSEWQPVHAVNVFPAAEREMLSIESRSHSSLTTLDHRWPVLRPHYRNGAGATANGTYKHVVGFDRKFATSGTLKWDDKVPIAADCADLPDEPKYTDAMVEAVAWFWTEGGIGRNRDGSSAPGVIIYQSTAAESNCDRIRSALTRVFGEDNGPFPRIGRRPDPEPRWRETTQQSGCLTAFVLNAAAGRILQQHAPGRVPSHPFLLSLTRAQLGLFIEASMLADNNGKASLAQKDRSAAEAFQFACILAGYATSLRPSTYQVHDRAGRPYFMQNVHLRSQRTLSPLKGKPGHGKPQRVAYSGEVWCPTTPNGTWLARRRGSVYFTGNSNWMRDVDLAAMRLIVPSSYLDNIGRGQGGVFEPDRRVFVPLEYLGAEGGPPQITANQFEIRWEAHQQTCVDLANRCVQEAGYSPQSFGDYAGPAVTATEIEARERTSLLTRSKKIRYWRPALQDIIYSLMCVSRKYFNATAIVPERPDVNFTAVAVPDATAMAQTVAALAGADAASKRTLVAMVHPEWAEEEINQEVAQILAETGIELAQHAKIALSAPMGETLTDEVTELAQPVNVQAPAPKDSDAEDEQQDSPEGD